MDCAVSPENVHQCTDSYRKGYSQDLGEGGGSPGLHIQSPAIQPFHTSSSLEFPARTTNADDHAIIAVSLEEFVRRHLILKEILEEKGLRVKAGKKRVMICCTGLDL